LTGFVLVQFWTKFKQIFLEARHHRALPKQNHIEPMNRAGSSISRDKSAARSEQTK
jgi:hypothetical protein